MIAPRPSSGRAELSTMGWPALDSISCREWSPNCQSITRSEKSPMAPVPL